MTDADILRGSFKSVEVNDSFCEAVLVLRDDSRLCFRHRVDLRQAEALGTGTTPAEITLAGQVLSKIKRFRLNGKHLDVEFQDSSRWELIFGKAQ